MPHEINDHAGRKAGKEKSFSVSFFGYGEYEQINNQDSVPAMGLAVRLLLELEKYGG